MKNLLVAQFSLEVSLWQKHNLQSPSWNNPFSTRGLLTPYQSFFCTIYLCKVSLYKELRISVVHFCPPTPSTPSENHGGNPEYETPCVSGDGESLEHGTEAAGGCSDSRQEMWTQTSPLTVAVAHLRNFSSNFRLEKLLLFLVLQTWICTVTISRLLMELILLVVVPARRRAPFARLHELGVHTRCLPTRQPGAISRHTGWLHELSLRFLEGGVQNSTCLMAQSN